MTTPTTAAEQVAVLKRLVAHLRGTEPLLAAEADEFADATEYAIDMLDKGEGT